MIRRFGVSGEIQSSITRIITGLGYSTSRAQELAKAVLETSNYFNKEEGLVTPWSKHSTLAAYLAYFLPLGLVRAQAVLQEANRLDFFHGLNRYVDWGSGPGTLSLVLHEKLKTGICVEQSREAIELHQKMTMDRKNIKWMTQISAKELAEYHREPGLLLTLSYSLNEMNVIPEWILSADALLIIEPSTQQAFKKLSDLRNLLIEKGWSIWAPCTHQGACPLQNEKDWCHDRILFDPPEWWSELELHLPMKNRSVTFSYLLAKKNSPVTTENLMRNTHYFFSAEENETVIQGKSARLVGDLKVEKGKTRQLVCRNSEREFLAWLHKEGAAPEWSRGELALISDQCIKVSNEIRKQKKPRP